MKNIKEILLVLSIILCCWLLVGIRYCYFKDVQQKDTISVVTDSIHDTVYIHKIDTLPIVKTSKIIKYVPIKEIETCLFDTITSKQADSTMLIVQKEYSDDSTYTAFISGIKYDDYPKLDSIDIRSRIVKETITKTITIQKKQSRWGISVSAGPTFDAVNGKVGAGVSVGLSYTIFRF